MVAKIITVLVFLFFSTQCIRIHEENLQHPYQSAGIGHYNNKLAKDQ